MKRLRVLLANRAVPEISVGSWTRRISIFIKNQPNFFDYILSPSRALDNSIYCKKRRLLSWKPFLREIQLKHWVARDYILAIKRLSKSSKELQIVVMDDLMLLQAISYYKEQLSCKFDLIFSFHGFHLEMDEHLLQVTDKILWLSQSGLDESKKKYDFFPKSIVIGNAVDSNLFFPLESSEFSQERLKLGYTESEEILVWLSNDRPQKGFHIFKEVVLELLNIQEGLKIIIVGSNQTINHPCVKSIGKIANEDVAKYLQISNYYMFTTLYEEGFGLSMIEALKCGNSVIASNRGAIPEILSGLPYTYLIDNPNDIGAWIKAFIKAQKDTDFGKKRISKFEARATWDYSVWEQKFLEAFK
jgi:glycosyltransferase involved in cell wall biosynthesis